MNHDRKEFELIHNKIDTIKEDIDDLKQAMDRHIKSYQDIKFIKENLFESKGLWARDENSVLEYQRRNGEQR